MTQAPPSSAVLLVEDNEDDIFLMRRLFRRAEIAFPLLVVTDGQQAVDYLAGANEYGDREKHPLPAVVFLDLKLPFLRGFDVLAWIRTQRQLDALKVVVLTSSIEDQDRERAEAFGVAYLVKPPQPEAIQAMLDSLR